MRGLPAPATRAHQILRDEGLLAFAERGARKLFLPLVRLDRYLFFEADLRVGLLDLRASVPLEIRPVTPRDIDHHGAALQRGGLAPDRARRRLELGDVGMLALHRGELVHFQWITFSPLWLDALGVALLLRPHESYVYDAVTLPEWRGMGIHPATLCATNRLQTERGHTHSLGYVNAGNRASLIVSLEKMGRRFTRTLWRIHPRGWKQPLFIGATERESPRLALSSPLVEVFER